MRTFFVFLFTISFVQLSLAQSDTNNTILANKILSLCEHVENDQNLQTDHFNPGDTSSLPIGIVKEIGNTKYIICIDSARYTPQGAYFNAYMAIDLPGANRKVAFQAKNVQFNPQGVVSGAGARLELASEQLVQLGPKMMMKFKNDGDNFIEWDCNGYTQAGLSIEFILNPDYFIHATDPSKLVKAQFQTVVQDLKNISVSIPSMDPFRIKGIEDFSFSLTNIVLDRSEIMNPPGVMLPNYVSQVYNGDVELWKGFYAQNISVGLPPELSPDGQTTTVFAQNLIIDDAGVSGMFGGTNLLNISNGKMENWGFSISQLAAQITCNKLTGGSLSGSVIIPILDNSEFNYTASITQDLDSNRLNYLFIVQPDSTVSMSCMNSTLSISKTSFFEVRSINNAFVPKAVLNGKWSWDSPKGSISGISFQNVTLVAKSPFITQGLFALTNAPTDTSQGSAPKLMRFPISLNQFGFATNQTNQLKLFIQLSLNLGDSPNNFSASTGLHIKTKEEIQNGRTTLVTNGVSIDNIQLSMNTTAFYLNGVIAVKENDPTFGDLFYGSIAFRLKSIMENNLNASVGFGKLPDFKYWFTELGAPVTIPITPTIRISKLYGGVQNRVQTTRSEQELTSFAFNGGSLTTSMNIPFVPNQNSGLVFRAGVAFENTKGEDLLNGEAMFNVVFNPNGGFASIGLNGGAYMMVDRLHRQQPNTKKIVGLVTMLYDHNNKVFDAQLDGNVVVPGALNGSVRVNIHASQNNWYIWINRPSNRALLNVVNLFAINAYFMVGTQIDPIPAPPNVITQKFGNGALNTLDQAAISSGQGFAAGAMLNTGFNKQLQLIGDWHGFVDATCMAGFDMTMFRVLPTAHCVGSTESIGINRWYFMGQVYGYVNASLGARRIKNNEIKSQINLAGISVAFLLQGRLPKPTYISGGLDVEFSFLTFDFGVNVPVSFGNDCQIVNI